MDDKNSQSDSLKEDRIGNFVYYGDFTFRDFVRFYVGSSLKIVNDTRGYPSTQTFYNEMIKSICDRFGLCQRAAMESYAPLHLYFSRGGAVNSSPMVYIYPTSGGGLLRVKQADGLEGVNLEDLTDKIILEKGSEINRALYRALQTQTSENSRGKIQTTPYNPIDSFEKWLAATRIHNGKPHLSSKGQLHKVNGKHSGNGRVSGNSRLHRELDEVLR